MTNSKLRPVFVVDGGRTPFIKAKGRRGPFTASDLAVACAKPILLRQPFSPEEFDEVIIGCVNTGVDEVNIARVISLRIGCGKSVPAFTVARNCASGMQALDSAALNIATGRSDLVLAGGTEAMSHAHVLVDPKMQDWLSSMSGKADVGKKLQTLMKFRPGFLKPVIGLIHGLTDPIVGLSMGQTAEELAYRFNISRERMDEFSMESHQRLADAIDNGHFTKLRPIFDEKGKVYESDDGLRRETTMEALAKLKPFFDRVVGSVTAGNSAQITDGAALLILASEKAVKKHNLEVLGRIVDSQWAGLDPSVMGLGPVYAMAPIMKRHKLKADDIDYWEINEAFAAQVLGCLAAWDDKEFFRKELKTTWFPGKIDRSKLNIDGGAISMGHPVGATGARLILHSLDILNQKNAKRAMASLCIGGGQGGAMMVERD